MVGEYQSIYCQCYSVTIIFEIEIPIGSVILLYSHIPTTGFIRHLLKNGMYAQCLLQADQFNSQAKGILMFRLLL